MIIYFKNGAPISVGANARGGYKMKVWADVPKQGTRPNTVYFEDNVRTHSFRTARQVGAFCASCRHRRVGSL